jgi:molybdopterin synthase sulfur carrier subunit
MAKVLIPVIFRGPTHGESSIETPFDTIRACFDAVEEKCPGVRELVIDPDTGGVHKFVKLTLNGTLLARDPGVLDKPVSATDEIEIVAAVAGG